MSSFTSSRTRPLRSVIWWVCGSYLVFVLWNFLAVRSKISNIANIQHDLNRISESQGKNAIKYTSTSTFHHEHPIINEDELKPPRNTTQSNMVVMVMSARSHFSRRQLIRETWGSGHDNIYFAVGTPCHVPEHLRNDELRCEYDESSQMEWLDKDHNIHQMDTKKEHALLVGEQTINNDILWTDEPETYSGLPHKLRSSLIWLYKNVPHAQWFTKVDDDMIVRVGKLAQYLNSSQNDPQQATVVGDIIYKAAVRTDGKWADPNYGRAKYPPWPRGSSGYAVNRFVAKYVTEKNKDLFISQGEDTSMGIWMDEAPFSDTVNWVNSTVFNNLKICNDTNYLVIGHDLLSEEFRICYKGGVILKKTTSFWTR